jgi:hypothetical protein
MLDWIWVSGALPPLCHVVNFVEGEVQQGCAGDTSNWGGGDNRVAKEDVAQD